MRYVVRDPSPAPTQLKAMGLQMTLLTRVDVSGQKAARVSAAPFHARPIWETPLYSPHVWVLDMLDESSPCQSSSRM